jgi:hypothetical protein
MNPSPALPFAFLIFPPLDEEGGYRGEMKNPSQPSLTKGRSRGNRSDNFSPTLLYERRE